MAVDPGYQERALKQRQESSTSTPYGGRSSSFRVKPAARIRTGAQPKLPNVTRVSAAEIRKLRAPEDIEFTQAMRDAFGATFDYCIVGDKGYRRKKAHE